MKKSNLLIAFVFGLVGMFAVSNFSSDVLPGENTELSISQDFETVSSFEVSEAPIVSNVYTISKSSEVSVSEISLDVDSRESVVKTYLKEAEYSGKQKAKEPAETNLTRYLTTKTSSYTNSKAENVSDIEKTRSVTENIRNDYVFRC